MTTARCLVLIAAFAACEKKTPAPAVTVGNGPQGLTELFEQARAACAAQDYAKGRAILTSIIPTRDQAKIAMRDEVSPAILDKIAAQSSEIPADDEKVACILSPKGRTEILVHAATTEEILAYQPGTLVEKEFPGGTKSIAPLLRPQMTFYEVETVEPGKDMGTKFHLFYWDGRQWRMLGPAWRYLDDAP